MDIIKDSKLTDNLKAKCIKSITIQNRYVKYAMGKEYIKGKIYRCNNSKNEIINTYRVFIQSKFPICAEFDNDSFKKYFQLINKKERKIKNGKLQKTGNI